MKLKIMMIFVFSILQFCVIISASFIGDNGGVKADEFIENSDSDALYLTPYIERGQIEKAQELATVAPLLKGVESFAGYLTVNKNCSSNIFFWLFKSQLKNWDEQPLVVWLLGGPGISSLVGLSLEVGPIIVTKKMKLKRSKFSWTRKYNVVFIDSPVGTGYSFTKFDSGYATDVNDVARDLLGTLTQLYTLFPALQKTKLFINGQSYGSRPAIALGYKIPEMNKVSKIKLPLAGLMIESGCIDPFYNIFKHSAFLYQVGMIDKLAVDKLNKIEEEAKADIKSGRFANATAGYFKAKDLIQTLTGQHHIQDFVHDDIKRNEQEAFRYVEEVKTRKAIHVGTNEFVGHSAQVMRFLKNNGTKSLRPWLEKLLAVDKLPILFYNGQLDIISAYPLALDLYRSLEWPHAKDYQVAKRCQFRVGDDVAGYFKTAGTFTEVLVRNAGHLVGASQPKWTFHLLDRFISNSSSFEC